MDLEHKLTLAKEELEKAALDKVDVIKLLLHRNPSLFSLSL